VSAAKHRAVLALRWPVDLALTVASHGWVSLAPWQWAPETGCLSRAEKINGQLGTITAEQRNPTGVIVEWDGFDADNRAEVLRRVRRWLSADWEPEAAIAALPELAGLIERGGGRMLRGSFFYEDFVKTVLTINANWPATRRMAAAMVDEPGNGSFPGPMATLDYGEARLRERAKLGFRARTIIAATRRMLDDGAITAAGHGFADRLAHEYLLTLGGIGPYAAAHCRVLLHDFSRIPVDSSVVAYMRAQYSCDPIEFAADRSDWGPYLALGYRMLRLRDKLVDAARAGEFRTIDRAAIRPA
jgi:3-methyladenine DNA glycosylase/8-oxoguanine DNA glycosylase